jgi:hypothetical protein
VGKSEGKRPSGRPKLRWMNNIKMDFRKTGCSDVDFNSLAQIYGPVEGSCEHGKPWRPVRL